MVIDQLRVILRTPEMIVKTFMAAQTEDGSISENEVRYALINLDPLWDELFPAEQARIVQLLVERVDVDVDSIEIRLRTNGLAGLVSELKHRQQPPQRAAQILEDGTKDRTGEVGGEQAPHVQLSIDRSAITVRVPLSLRRRGGRKVVVSPPGTEPWTRPSSRTGTPLVIALARAFRWKHMLDVGANATITDIAAAEKLDRSFVSNCLRLTLLAPAIVESILAETHAEGLQLQTLMRSLP